MKNIREKETSTDAYFVIQKVKFDTTSHNIDIFDDKVVPIFIAVYDSKEKAKSHISRYPVERQHNFEILTHIRGKNYERAL